MSRLKYILTVPAMMLVLCAMVWAQSSKGVVVGTVNDSSEAVLSGATVKITNLTTNVTRELPSNEQGTFRFEAVDPGNYKVEASAEGFKTTLIDNVIVAAAQNVNINLKLDVGGGDQIIEVTADAVVLQTQDGARTNTLSSREIVDLPVASLNPVDLVFTLPGVTAPGSLAGGFVQGTEFSINGLRPRSNNQLIDGTDNNDNSITGQAYQPSLRDGYQEVSVLGADNSAEYGRGGGAVVNLVTKSGTNQFHGSVYDVISPSALSSLSSGDKLQSGLTSVPVTIQNQYGFSIGGPIVKNKLFFFGTFQESPFRAGGVVANAVVPTAAGFQQLRALFPSGASANLDRYLSVVGDARGTTTPRLIALGGGRPAIEFGIATATSTQPVDDTQFLTRVDFTPNDKDSFAFRYLIDDQQFVNQFPTVFRAFQVDVPSRQQNFYASYTRVISPKLVNEFRFAYSKFTAIFAPPNQGAIDFGPTIAFAGTTITGVGLAATFPQGRNFNNYQFQDTVTYNFSSHTVRAGVDLVRQTAMQFVPFNNRGTLTYTAGGGFGSFGNFVDGFSGTAGVFAAKVFGSPITKPNSFQQSYFINDTWRAKSNLTLNLGLRYENFGTPFNVVPFPAFAGFNVPINTVVKQKRDDNNFAPRFSFAYTPKGSIFGEDKTVFRGGLAVTYDIYFNNILSNTAAASPNVFGATLLGGGQGPRGIAGAGPGTLPTTGAPNPLTGITTIDPNLVNPQIFVFNFGVQRELPLNLIAEATYVGSRGTRLFINEQLNPGVRGRRLMTTRGPITARTNGGDSIYHSLQTRLERGFRNGLFVRFAYTFSKTIDNTSEVFVTTGGSSLNSNPFNRNEDRSVSAFDAKHRAVVTYVWDIPGPKSGVLGQVLGNYTVSGSYRLQTGTPETVYVGGIDLNQDLNAFNDRPSISNPNAPRNSVAISDGAGGFTDADGNPVSVANSFYIVGDPGAPRGAQVGRNSIRGGRTSRMDFSFNKSIKMPFEGHKIDLRFEFFNAFNTPVYTFDGTVSDGDVLNPNFNNVKLNDGGNRTGRFQLRYSF